MNTTILALLIAVGTVVCMVLFFEGGRRYGLTRSRRGQGSLPRGSASAEGAVFGLLGLIIAFTFSGAATRFEARRHQIANEATLMGTAFLRLDLVPSDARNELRVLFRQYVGLRSVVFANASDYAGTVARNAESVGLQKVIWTKALAACRMPDADPDAAWLLLPALNEMFDITVVRAMATRNHPPVVIFLLLGGLSLMSALLIGYDLSTNQKRSWFHPLIFAAAMSLSLYVILELEFPRLGLIQVSSADKVLVELLADINATPDVGLPPDDGR